MGAKSAAPLRAPSLTAECTLTASPSRSLENDTRQPPAYACSRRPAHVVKPSAVEAQQGLQATSAPVHRFSRQHHCTWYAEEKAHDRSIAAAHFANLQVQSTRLFCMSRNTATWFLRHPGRAHMMMMMACAFSCTAPSHARLRALSLMHLAPACKSSRPLDFV